MNALTYLTRRCPRDCNYCMIKYCGPKTELTPDQWIDAFKVLKEIGVDFNLIQGNEPWLLGKDLVKIMKANEVPFAMYTTAPPYLFKKYHKLYFENGIDSMACGVDYSLAFLANTDEKLRHLDDTVIKSIDGWEAMLYTKKHYPKIDVGPTITIHSINILGFEQFLEEVTLADFTFGVNFINWNKDGGYDFCSTEEDIKELLFDEDNPKHFLRVDRFFKLIKTDERAKRIHNYDSLLDMSPMDIFRMGWHCQGDPYGGPTIDCDGSLRCCGYRMGTRTPAFDIFSLRDSYAKEKWKEAVYADAMDCPGCVWSCPMMYHYYEGKAPGSSKQMFTNHANSQQKGVKRCVA
jgi:MoaA/NifB/PqqE/SkfB family radical SAM enzyme